MIIIDDWQVNGLRFVRFIWIIKWKVYNLRRDTVFYNNIRVSSIITIELESCIRNTFSKICIKNIGNKDSKTIEIYVQYL